MVDFKCETCMKYMHPPIITCESGHSFCEKCLDQELNCPICGAPKKETRNYTVERFWMNTVFPCENKSYGCRVTGTGPEVSQHQEDCNYKPETCVYSQIDGCDWTGSPFTFDAHMRKMHPDTYPSNIGKFKIGSLQFMSSSASGLCKKFYTDKELFFFRYFITMGRIKAWIVKMTNFTKKDFIYRITISHKDKQTEAIKIECPISYTSDIGCVDNLPHVCWLTRYIKEFGNENGDVFLSCTIESQTPQQQ